MPLTIVCDLDTLYTFLIEMGELWKESSNKLIEAKDRYERQYYINELKMYINLNQAIIEEASILA